MKWLSIVVLVLVGAVTPAHADAWYEGRAGHRRVIQLSIAATGGALFLVSETVLKSSLAPSACRWCKPDGLDASWREALVWRNPGTAQTISNITGYVAAPVSALGFLVIDDLSADAGATWGVVLDDALPVLEAAAVGQVITQAAKFSVGRERPFVHYGAAAPHQIDDDLSFFSGHSSLTASLAVSAGMIASKRHPSIAPYVWASGATLALATGYLRIAGDKHYFTDVLTGLAVGTVAGFGAAKLALSDDVAIVPTANGFALAGAF